MADTRLDIIISAQDRASRALAAITSQTDQLQRSVDNLAGSNAQSEHRVQGLTRSFIQAEVAVDVLRRSVSFVTDQFRQSITSANLLNNSLTGLSSIARAFGQDANRAKREAQGLAADGLMSVANAATGLKNLLAAGFNIDQAVILMRRFKDSAAFGRQSALSFGQAVASVTEGIKNGNSILVDNAGVTKNLSVILTEAGFSAQDLQRATSDATVRQALFNGILKETIPQLGDAARLSGQLSGQQSRLNSSLERLHATVGTALAPGLTVILGSFQRLVDVATVLAAEHGPGVSVALVSIASAATNASGMLATLHGWFAQNRGTIEAVASVITVALLPQLVATAAQLVRNIALWAVHNAQAIGNAIIQTYLYITSGWQMVAVLTAQAIRLGISTAQWAALNAIMLIGLARVGLLTPAILAQVAAQRAASVATGLWTAAQWALNVALSANPIGLVIIAITALAAGLIVTTGRWNAFRDAAVGAIQPVVRSIQELIGWIGRIPAVSPIAGAARQLRIPGFAAGTSFAPGGLAMVGERGPELVNLPRGSRVFPNQESRQMAGGNTYTFNHYGDIRSDVDIHSAFREMGFRVTR
ncbi:MAG: hypothetical protein M3Q71_00060 [Chloroflexota bacterium]|nr:hypothetical protein [Chloroflexota bacterium]